MNIIKLALLHLVTWVMGAYTPELPAQDFTRPSLRVMVDDARVHHGLYLTHEPRTYWVITETGQLEQQATQASSGAYLPVRHFVDLFGGETHFDPATRVVTVTHEERVTFPQVHFLVGTAYMPVHYIEEMFGYHVHHDIHLNVLHIDRQGQGFDDHHLRQFLPSFDGYTADDLHWLSRIIFAEARGETFEGMVAVGSVVMNRVAHPSYPNTVHGVVFDRRNGIQFSPTANGAINNSPCINSFLAALDVLEGHRNASDALFFMNPRIAQTSWISRNRAYAFTLDNHSFFY